MRIVPLFRKEGLGEIYILMKRLIEYNKKLKSNSRNLRRDLTSAEKTLWNKIRRRQLENLQFYRQKIIGNYIVDFFCSKAKLVIEIDGGQHCETERIAEDELRTKYLKSKDFKVLRFTNIEILQNLESVVNKILEEIS